MIDFKELQKKSDAFWNVLTQEEFEKIWDELKLNEFYNKNKKFKIINDPITMLLMGIMIGIIVTVGIIIIGN
ncbi:MAG: hypothetical protein PHP92_03440 [Candidatus Nanoarchaeia archaeon]|nr:hypothetical protein [Candidatus Nanoarchaeia archaeon]